MRNNNLKVLIFILFFTSLSLADGKFIKKKFGQYTVLISQNFESGIGKLTINQGNKTVYEESGVDNHYYFGNNFDETQGTKDIYSGHNITGNGLQNLILSNWTGGAHCCHFLHIFELGKEFKKLATVEANSSSLRLIDLDHDGHPEIEFWDGAIDYLFTSFSHSPGGRVVLKFKNGRYDVAAQLMKKPRPSVKKMQLLKAKIIKSFKTEESPNLPYDFLNIIMELSYTGHFDQALKIIDDTSSDKTLGLAKFKEDYIQALQKSLYWRNL